MTSPMTPTADPPNNGLGETNRLDEPEKTARPGSSHAPGKSRSNARNRAKPPIEFNSGSFDREHRRSSARRRGHPALRAGLSRRPPRPSTAIWPKRSLAAATKQRQAPSLASMAGIGTGLVDFGDVTGQTGAERRGPRTHRASGRERPDLADHLGRRARRSFRPTLFLGAGPFTAFIGFLMVVALAEFYTTLRRQGFVPIALFGLIGVIGVAIAAHFGGPGPMLVTIVVLPWRWSPSTRSCLAGDRSTTPRSPSLGQPGCRCSALRRSSGARPMRFP